MTRATIILAFTLLACGCAAPTTIERVEGAHRSARPAQQIEILAADPQRAFRTIATITVSRYKPGWNDPVVSDAYEKLRAAAFEAGGDAVIVRDQRAGGGTRIIDVTAQVIVYLD